MKKTIIAVACLITTLAGCNTCTNIGGNDNGNSKKNTEIDLSKVTVAPEEMVDFFHYSKPSGMMAYSEDNGEIQTDEGEILLAKTENGGTIKVRYDYVKRDTISVGEDVIMEVSKMVKAYNMKENQGSYTDSEHQVTDVGPWSCSITLNDGTNINGSVVIAFYVKDEKRMEKCAEFSAGAKKISAYLYSLTGH